MKSDEIKRIVLFIFTIICMALAGFYIFCYFEKLAYEEEQRKEQIKIAREKEAEEKKALEEEKEKKIARQIYAEYTHPKPGLAYENLGYTQIGKPHQVIKLNPGDRYDIEAKWYLEDEQYNYECTAYLYNIHRGGTYIASPRYSVKLFEVVGFIKGTNYRRLYTEGYYKDRNDFETGKYYK